MSANFSDVLSCFIIFVSNFVSMAVKLVVFDLDGTLLNTIGDLAAACNHVLVANGYPTHELEQYKIFVGSGVRRLVERALPDDVPETEVERMRDEFVEYYAAHIDGHTVPYDGMRGILRSLHEASVKVAVLSNKFHAGTCRLVSEYFPDMDFFAVYGQRPDIPLKPDTYMLCKLMEDAGAKPSETVFVGDSGIDMDTANAAGVLSVGVTWGFRSKDELVSHSARVLVDSPGQLEQLLMNYL